MKNIGIVSCDKWQNVLEEDKNLKQELLNLGLKANIISWQQPLDEKYDMLVLRSVWGYQNYYHEFKKWLLDLKKNNIPIANDVDIILSNIRKDIQFEILKNHHIDYIDTIFFNRNNLSNIPLLDKKNYVIKPSISGSGENTYLVTNSDHESISNTIKSEEIYDKYSEILENNQDCKIMVQPFIKEINDGEYSCIFIEGELTHTMLRFPNIFHDKKKPYLVKNVPKSIINLAKKVEKIEEFKGYLYMRVDMVLINGQAKIMEVELAEPDLLTKYINDSKVKEQTIKTLSRKIARRVE